MAGAAYFADASEDTRPKAVGALRVLLWINAAITAVMVVAGAVAAGVSVDVVAHLVVLAVPGAVAGTVAWRITHGSAGTGRDLYVGLLAAMAWQVIRAVSNLLGGDPRGLTSMALPLAIVILAARPSVRLDLRAQKPAAGSYGIGDRGASLIEYAGLIVLAALILGSLVALGLPSQVRTGTGEAVCRILGGGDCSPAARRGPAKTGPNGGRPNANPPGGRTNGTSPRPGAPALPNCHGFLDCKWKAVTADPYDVAQKIPCTGFLSCIEHGAEVVSSYPYNTAKAVLDDGKGIVDLVEHPTSLADALSYIVDHPADTLRQLVWDDETAKLWQKGDYGGAVARTLWNVGSWALPGVDIAKVFSKAGKFAKLGKLADKAGKLGRLGKLADDSGKAAKRAERLADKGDAVGAKKAADDAKRAADEAKKEARKSGCKIVGLGEPALRPLLSVSHLGRYAAAAPMALPAQPTCGRAQIAEDAYNAAKESAERATREKNLNRALSRGRYEDADNLIDQARKAAKDAADRAKDRPTAENKEAARKAARAAEIANKRVINQKIADALRSTRAGERAEGDVGQALKNNLVNFQKKYGPHGRDGEVDAETSKAIIESKAGTPGRAGFKKLKADIRKKMANPHSNPNGKPMIVYAPNLSAYQAERLAQATGATVVRTTSALKSAVRALGEPVS